MVMRADFKPPVSIKANRFSGAAAADSITNAYSHKTSTNPNRPFPCAPVAFHSSDTCADTHKKFSLGRDQQESKIAKSNNIRAEKIAEQKDLD
jgi:hypothetical protein